MKVHVGKAGDAAAHIFRDLQHRAPVDILFRQVLFEREDPVIQPAFQGHIVGGAAEQAHRRVGVGVAKAAHQQVAAAVVGPFGGKCFIGRTYTDDGVAVDAHFAFCDRLAGRCQNFRVYQPLLHLTHLPAKPIFLNISSKIYLPNFCTSSCK